MTRRQFLRLVVTGVAVLAGEACSSPAGSATLVASPVATNRLRPPGAVAEKIFPAKCIRCGRCVEVCPYRTIIMLDIRDGIHAGTPLVEAEKVPCYLCMKCVEVCPTGSLLPIRQQETRMGLAVINTFTCYTYTGVSLCRTCYDKCPFVEKAIRLDQLRPVVNENHCTGCGICTHACPVTDSYGLKAINVEPVYADARRHE